MPFRTAARLGTTITVSVAAMALMGLGCGNATSSGRSGSGASTGGTTGNSGAGGATAEAGSSPGGTTGSSGSSTGGSGSSTGGAAGASASSPSGGSGSSTSTGSGGDSAVATGPYLFKKVRTGGGGGFIVDILFHPKQKDLIYAKTDIGGVYKWNPSTSQWSQLLDWIGPDDWNWTGVESVAIDPSDPSRLYVAAGTYTNGWAPTNGAILRSTDQGKTFQITKMPFKMGGNMPGRGMGERLAVDPNMGSILYFGAREGKGLWKSTDSGATWTNVASFPDPGPFCENPTDPFDYANHPVGIPWVIFDPSSGKPGSPSQRLYAGVAQNGSGKPNLYRSNDGGTTWEPVPGQPTCSVAGTIVTCTGGATWDTSKMGNNTSGYLPHQGKLDSAGTLYVTYNNWEGPYNGSVGDVWKFVPSTSTWTQISPVAGSQAPANLYWGYGGLAVDPQKAGTLVVSTVNAWWPDANMWRSTDGGHTWKPAWTWNGYPARAFDYTLDISSAPWLNNGVTSAVPPLPVVKLGWMMEGMSIDPFNSDRMMYGTGETLFGTTNLTGWDTAGMFTIASTAVGIEETSVLGLVSPPNSATGGGDSAHLFSVVGDVGGWRHDDLDKAPATLFSIPYFGTNNSIDFAENKPQFLVRVGTGSTTATPPYRGSAFTNDGGATWFAGNADPVPGQGGGTVAAAADASRVVWAGGTAPVSYSSDNGSSWKPSTTIPAGSFVASDRVNAQKFYGFGQGKFWTSTDGGATFTASAAAGLPATGKIKAVFGHEGDVWLTGGLAATGGANQCTVCGLWRTTDSGATFTSFKDVTTAEGIGFGMAKPGGSGYPAVFLAGTVGGVHAIFRSDDAGATWTQITDPQHQFATIQAITGDPRVYGRVYIGTNGLGIVYGDIAR